MGADAYALIMSLLHLVPNDLLACLHEEIDLVIRERAAAAATSSASGRCTNCQGFGRREDGAYCACAMGRDLARAEKGIHHAN